MEDSNNSVSGEAEDDDDEFDHDDYDERGGVSAPLFVL